MEKHLLPLALRGRCEVVIDKTVIGRVEDIVLSKEELVSLRPQHGGTSSLKC